MMILYNITYTPRDMSAHSDSDPPLAFAVSYGIAGAAHAARLAHVLHSPEGRNVHASISGIITAAFSLEITPGAEHCFACIFTCVFSGIGSIDNHKDEAGSAYEN